MENILIVIWCTFVNISLKNFLFLYNFLAIASFTLIFLINYFTFAAAVIARALRLRVHTRSEHLHSSDHTTTFTSFALLNSALFATNTIAFRADALSVDGNFRRFACVNFLKSYFKWMHYGLSLFWASWLLSSTSHTEKSSKQIIHASCVSSSILYAIFSIFVVKITLLFV
jgi:hypothetical protein